MQCPPRTWAAPPGLLQDPGPRFPAKELHANQQGSQTPSLGGAPELWHPLHVHKPPCQVVRSQGETLHPTNFRGAPAKNINVRLPKD